MPERTLALGDPYHCDCLKTARLLRERLELASTDLEVTFQSRFGKAAWLQPYTEPRLIELAKSGIRKVDVMCPGFVSDCVETLEEICLEAAAAFKNAGGTAFGYIHCLNDEPEWISALEGLVLQHLGGWPLADARRDDERAAQAARARNHGALQ